MTEEYIKAQKERDARSVQQIAEALWNIATSENKEFATYNTTVYRSLETALKAALKVHYKLNRKRANQVRDLLAEYGPYDSLSGTKSGSRGIESYVEYALQHDAEERF